MFVNRCCEMDKNGINMNSEVMNFSSSMNSCCQESLCQPIMECPQERVCHVNTCYNVPHIIPINTRIINHHIYRHTYQPMYTCCTQDEVCNIYDNPCNF